MKKWSKRKKVIISILSALLIVLIGAYSFYSLAPFKKYGDTHVTVDQYNSLIEEQYLVSKINYGYEYYLAQVTEENPKTLPDSKIYSDSGFPEFSIDAEQKLTQQANTKKNENMGDVLMSEVDDEMTGVSDLRYSQTGTALDNFGDQIESIKTTAIIALGNQGVYSNNKSKNKKISAEFRLRVERDVNDQYN